MAEGGAYGEPGAAGGGAGVAGATGPAEQPITGQPAFSSQQSS